MKIYLDNCCFNRPYDSQSNIQIKLEAEAKLYIQFLVKNHKIDIVWSYIFEHENNQNPFDERRNAVQKWKSFCSEVILENESILLRAGKYKDIGFKTKDAIHIGCAVEAKCEYFVTVDFKIINKKRLVSDIKIISLLDLIQIIGKESDEGEK